VRGRLGRMKTSVVLFDAAGVLFPLNKVVGEELQRRFGLAEEHLASFWSDGLYKELTLGRIGTEEFLAAFAETFSLPRPEVTKQLFLDAFEKALSPMPGVQELLAQLKKTGVHLALLSDTVEMYTDVRHQLGYYKHFEKFFFSYEIGHRKPEPEAYQAVINHYKVAPAEIFFVDDQPNNVEGAKQQGLRAVVFTDAQALERVFLQEGILLPAAK